MQIILLFLLTISVFAESRLSSFSLNYTDDQEDYQAYQFNANWGFNEKLQLGVSIFSADISGEESKEVSLSGRYFITDFFDANGFIARRNEPNELSSRSYGFGGTLELSYFWNGELRTFITGSATRSDYEQDQTTSGTFTTVEFQTKFAQGEYILMLEQEFASWLTIAANYTTYIYQDDSLVTATSSFSQLNFNVGFNGVSDYPDSRVGGVIIFSPSDYYDFELSYQDTKSNVAELDSTEVRTLLTVYATESLSLNFGYSQTQIESSDDINILDLGFGYFF